MVFRAYGHPSIGHSFSMYASIVPLIFLVVMITVIVINQRNR